MIMDPISFDPGVIPSKPSPGPGETIAIEVDGLPPHKDEHRSIRNASHPQHARFIALRKRAIEVMAGRAWSSGPIGMEFVLFAPARPVKPTMLDFAAGIEDTLDGSSGCTFTFLPILFQDDCQICKSHSQFEYSAETRYRVAVTFLL
jgi:hypothetical protein